MEIILIAINSLLLFFTSIFVLKLSKEKFLHLLLICNAVFFFYFISPYFFLYSYFIDTFGEKYILLSQFYFLLSYLFFLFGYFISYLFLIQRSEKNRTYFSLERFSKLKIKKMASLFFLILPLICFLILMELVSGLKYYLTHLADTGVLTAGKIYLIAGILSVKFFFFAQFFSFFKKRKNVYLFLIFVFISFLITITGRLNFIIFIIQFFLIYYYLIKNKLNKKILIGFLILFILITFIYGEYRFFTGIALKRGYNLSLSSFIDYLQRVNIKNELISRVFLLYFDGNYSFLEIISKIDKGETEINKGKDYLGLFFKPIPRFLRTPFLKGITAEEEMKELGFGYGRVNSILGMTFLNFSYLGIILMLAFGFFVSFVQDNLLNSLSFKKRFLGIIIYPHILSQIRMSFVGSGPLLFIDLFFLFLFLSFVKKRNL